MRVKLKQSYSNFLVLNLESNVRGAWCDKLLLQIRNYGLLINIDEETADEIRDWAAKELQRVGFDKQYNLTKEGKILEALIDLFNH